MKIFFEFIEVFGKKYRASLVLLLFLSVMTGVIELLGIGLILPLIGVISDPSIIETNNILSSINTFLGFTSAKGMTYFIAALIGGTFIFKGALSLFYQYFQFNTITKWKNDICELFMDMFLASTYENVKKKSASQIINTLTVKIYFVVNHFILQNVMLISNLVIIFILFLFLLYKFFFATVGALVFFGILFKSQTYIIKKISEKIGREIISSKQKNLSILSQSIGVIKQTKINMRESFFSEQFKSTNAKVSKLDRDFILLSYAPTTVTEVFLVFGIIGMCIYILSGAGQTSSAIAELAVLVSVLFRLAPLFNRVLGNYANIRGAQESTLEVLSEYRELLEQPQENWRRLAESSSFSSLIEVKNLSFNYDDTQILKDLSFQIEKGEFIGIVGVSGSGKTTLMDLLMGLLYPTSGRVLYDNKELLAQSARDLRSMFSYVPQEVNLINDSIVNNIAFGHDGKVTQDQESKINKILKDLKLEDFISHELDRCSVQEGATNLSGGQRQRIGLARALFSDPQILFLDEATSALDMETENEISKIFQKLKGKLTIVAIAHRLSTLKECDKLIYLEDGEIVDIGNFDELRSKNPKFESWIEMNNI